MNPRSDNNEALVKWETIALDVNSGVNFLGLLHFEWVKMGQETVCLRGRIDWFNG
jgi:hypothetical protein